MADGSLHKLIAKQKLKLAPGSCVSENFYSIKISELTEHKEMFLADGEFRILGEVSFTIYENVEENGKWRLDRKLKHENSLFDTFRKKFDRSIAENLHHYSEFSDFKIKSGSGEDVETFDVHKLILSLHSPVFKALLESNCIESESNMVEVPDVPKEAMQNLIKFLYTDEIDDRDIDGHLLAAADKYQVCRLKTICECILLSNLNVGNAMEIGVASHFHGSEIFKEEVTKYIARQWSTLQKENMGVIKHYPELLLEIMSHIVNQ